MAEQMTTMAANDSGYSQQHIEYLLMHLALHQNTFDAAYAQLDPDLFNRGREMPYRHIWRCMKQHWHDFGCRPTREALSIAAIKEVANDPLTTAHASIAKDVLAQTQAIIDFMYDDGHKGQLEPHLAIHILRDFLIERGPKTVLIGGLQAAQGGAINLPALVAAAQRRIEDIEALGRVDADYSTVPASWDQVAVPRYATGIEWIDRIMGGGGEPGNVNVLLGPTGGGKTTTAMQIAASTARLQTQLERRGHNDTTPGLVVFVSYEDDLRMLQIRAASYGAQILKDRLRDLTSDNDLSTVGNLQPYEQQMYAESRLPIAEQLGERERLDAAATWLNKHLALVDFHDPSKGGRGGIMEVKTKLAALQDKHGMPIKAVVLDWAGNLVTNYLQGKDGTVDGSRMSLELQNLVNRAKHELAAPFNCVVWVPHQLTGRCNKASPATFPHHSDAQWCTTFADHAWYAFVLGTKEKEHSICQFGATKTRHGETPAPIILKIDGAWCCMRDVSNAFQIDKISGALCPTKEIDQFYDHRQSSIGVDQNSR